MIQNYVRDEHFVEMDAEMLAKRCLSAPDYYFSSHLESLGTREEFPIYKRVLAKYGIEPVWKQGHLAAEHHYIRIRKIT